MKKLIIPLTVLLFTACNENEKKISASDVPSSVQSAFNAKYPNASDVKWEQEKEKGKLIYEAEFKFNGKEIEAEFDSTGTFIEEE